MASRSVSPGGALLRASRVFSMPSPLPQPQPDLSSTAIFNSDSATLPYPTHLTVTTPQSSLNRGDWGFKRPLPLRSTTRTSTPFIKVKSIDTLEHITEFGSAADHALTLQKWQEMGVPLSTPGKTNSPSNFPTQSRPSGRSVFEDSIDTIAHPEGQGIGKDDVRWKFSGPWLAGLTEGDFNTYIQEEVRRRKHDFRQFLRTACANETTQAQHRTASDAGEDIPPAVEAGNITDEQLTDYIKGLRRDRLKLNKHIRSFLDLPPSPNYKATEDFFAGIGSIFPKIQDDVNNQIESASDSPYADSGPPKTHPSAGLSYSRTSSYLYNHPVYGPQRNKPPVQARVLMPKGAATGNFSPVLGIGGIAVSVPAGDASFDTRNTKGARNGLPQIPGIFNVDPDAVGGSKAWVHPKHAHIDPKGRVKLTVVTADPEAIAVKEGTVSDIPKVQNPPFRSLSMTNSRPGPYGGGYGVSRGEFSARGEDRARKGGYDAVKELAGLVDGQRKA